MRYAPELAEAIGTFSLVFAGAGAIMVATTTASITHLGIALTFGLVVGAMIYAVGHVSGAHFNPAVTLAFAATGHFPWRRVAPYLGAQVGGAVLAALLLRWIMGDVADMGSTSPATDFDAGRVFVVEVLITAMLMFVIASVATDGRAVGKLAGSAIGSTVALNAFWAGPLTGASMNPARSLGPALVAGESAFLYLYVLAPIAGALLGAGLYELVRRGSRPTKERT